MFSDRIKNLRAYQPVTGSYSVRLDANESGYNLPAKAVARIAERVAMLDYNRYPDPYAEKLCAAFAGAHGLPGECVVAGNGSDELISLIFQTFAERRGTVLIPAPDFSMYRQYAEFLGLRIADYRKNPDFSVSVPRMAALANASGADIIVFSNPCNPTSLKLTEDEVMELYRSVRSLVVVDEAYMEFSDGSVMAEAVKSDRLFVLRTLSKAYSGAAVRLGFAVGSAELIRILKAAKSPYNVSSLDQIAGEVILENRELLLKRAAEIRAAAKELELTLRRFPSLKVMRTNANFVTAVTDDYEKIDKFLKSRGICVRAFRNFLRITSGTAEENAALIGALEEFYNADK